MYLIKTTEIYRIETDVEVKNFIEECKKDPLYELDKYSSKIKYIHKGKEDEESYFEVQIVKSFNDPKEPISKVNINYELQ